MLGRNMLEKIWGKLESEMWHVSEHISLLTWNSPKLKKIWKVIISNILSYHSKIKLEITATEITEVIELHGNWIIHSCITHWRSQGFYQEAIVDLVKSLFCIYCRLLIDFSPRVHLCALLYSMSSICWTIFASLERIQHDHGA